MGTYFCHATADILLEQLACQRSIVDICAKDFQNDARVNARDITQLCTIFNLPQKPVHVLVGQVHRRSQSSKVVSHVWRQELPLKAFYTIAPNVHVSSVPFLLLQLAQRLDCINLCQVIMRHTGNFSLSSDNGVAPERAPLTSVQSLHETLCQVRNVYGIRKLHRVLGYVIGGANSPMEVNLALALSLPKTLGGFGLKKPVLNHRITLSRAARRLYNASYVKVDLCWPEAGFGLEYNGYEFHRGRESADISRAMALREMGIGIRFVTYEQLRSDVHLMQLAYEVARRTRKSRFEVPTKLNTLLSQLLHPVYA